MARLYLTRPERDETAIHEAVAKALDILLLPPAVWFCYPAGHGLLTAAAAAKSKRLGLKPALPDIWIIHHGAHCIELKDRQGQLSRTRIVRTKRGRNRIIEGQEDMIPKLRAAGVKVAICRSTEDALAQVRAWNIPMLPFAVAA